MGKFAEDMVYECTSYPESLVFSIAKKQDAGTWELIFQTSNVILSILWNIRTCMEPLSCLVSPIDVELLEDVAAETGMATVQYIHSTLV